MQSVRKKFDLNGYNRATAILFYKGKFYEEDNHQLALAQILKDENTSYQERYGIFEEDPEDTTQATDITYQMQEENGNDVIGMDVFETDIGNLLVIHFKEDAKSHMETFKAYAHQNNLKLASYVDYFGWLCELQESE